MRAKPACFLRACARAPARPPLPTTSDGFLLLFCALFVFRLLVCRQALPSCLDRLCHFSWLRSNVWGSFCQISLEVNAVQHEQDVNNSSTDHDPDVLPHDYSSKDMDEIFTKAVVPDDDDCAPVSACMCGRPDCKQCFPPRPQEFGTAARFQEAWMVQHPDGQQSRRWPRGIDEM